MEPEQPGLTACCVAVGSLLEFWGILMLWTDVGGWWTGVGTGIVTLQVTSGPPDSCRTIGSVAFPMI